MIIKYSTVDIEPVEATNVPAWVRIAQEKKDAEEATEATDVVDETKGDE